MALAVGNISNATAAISGSLTWSHTVASGDDRVLFVLIAGWSATRTVTSVTFNSDNLQQVKRETNSFGFAELWVLPNPDVTTGDIVVTFNSSSYSAAGAINFSGGNPDDPIGAIDIAEGGSGNVVANLTTLFDGSYVVDSVMKRGGPTMTPEQTQIYMTPLGGVITGAGQYVSAPTTGSYSMDWTSGSADWTTIIFEVREKTSFVESEQTVTAKANIIVFEEKTQTITAKGHITVFETKPVTITAKARISYIEKTILVSPENFATEVQSPVTLVWKIPRTVDESNINAHVQIDQTDNTFGDLEAELFSFRDSGFEFWDGDSWEPYPVLGVSNDYAGNEARVTVSLTAGTKHWRVRGGRG